MKHCSYIFPAILAVLGTFVSCHSDKKSNILVEHNVPYEPQEHRMPEYNFSDTVSIGSHKYVYTIHREPSDSLPKVKDEMGDTYFDNFYQLSIERDNASFFEHRFVKRDLNAFLSRDFQRNGIIDGFRFINAEGGRLIFGLCVSYPDSDMSSPFLLTIAPNASFVIEPDDVMDVEETADTASI